MVAAALKNKTIHTTPFFLSCDWGTSSFRLRLVASDTGSVITAIKDKTGIKEIYKRWTAYGGELSRIDFYQSFLMQKVEELKSTSPVAVDYPPVILSGMASSSIGIKELAYAPLPFELDDPNLNIEMVAATDRFPCDLYLVSGLCSSDDVMRGEETELLGLHSTLNISEGLFLLAGTHSKHVVVEDRTVISFKTYMTGELFDIISSQSILSASVAEDMDSAAAPGRDFKKGVEEAQQKNLLHSLFGIRARDLLRDTSDKGSNYDFLSGLLIGTELKEMKPAARTPIILWGSSRLQQYYAAALDVLGRKVIRPEIKEEEEITSLGQRSILRQINTNN
ncbi:2-dehydro-3-deoxygalactonokinase [Fodinibius roseus]|uniref:2-dehydro-3-deoxygalactonokinase n=1 Tax=Fodinibius roseus TaxID=1194090 RepID=A0A1M4TT57_9BACT|nr:2-dehydro-3-deoxygalactonokinase [Fodinibius roseus]SHE47565.1 2-dehydro-3-deoxygalactonokinase [Fodinibius roseus]